jgi:hypothetical protein
LGKRVKENGLKREISVHPIKFWKKESGKKGKIQPLSGVR